MHHDIYHQWCCLNNMETQDAYDTTECTLLCKIDEVAPEKKTKLIPPNTFRPA